MVLIVDDNYENIFSLKSLLQLNKFEVDTASSGEEALKKVLKNSYALIILDVQMPGMDGFEVAEALSGYSKAKDIPIIFLSAVNTHKKFITQGYASGGIDYLTKPFDADILLLKVKTFYRLSMQTRELIEIHEALREEIEIRKKAEKELKDSVEELRSILESIPNLSFTSRPNGSIEFVNQQWFAYADKKECFPTAEDITVEECLRKAIDSQHQLIKEVSIKKLNSDQFRYYLLCITPVKKDNHIVKWVGIFTDIHVQKTASNILEKRVIERTAELQKMNRELEVSNGELQQFASVASHDLQEPLRKIQVFSNMLRDKFLLPDNDAFPYVNKIINSSDRMRELINDLLDYSGLSSNNLFKKANLNQVLNDILNDLEVIIKNKKATITFDLFPELDIIPGQMRQVFQNLISNALKFSKDNVPPVISIRVNLVEDKAFDAPISPAGLWCRMSISDNGIGFNEIYLDRIFTIFQRLNPKEVYAGTGIGLAIVKKVIDKHEGIVTAFSKEGEGSTFIIVIPVHQNI